MVSAVDSQRLIPAAPVATARTANCVETFWCFPLTLNWETVVPVSRRRGATSEDNNNNIGWLLYLQGTDWCAVGGRFGRRRLAQQPMTLSDLE